MNRIKELREDLGIYQQQLANMLDVKQVTVSSWEVGNSFPTVPTLLRLSKIFGCSIDYIVGNESDEGIVNITQEISYEQELLLSLLQHDKMYSTLLRNFCKLTELQKNSILQEMKNLTRQK